MNRSKLVIFHQLLDPTIQPASFQSILPAGHESASLTWPKLCGIGRRGHQRALAFRHLDASVLSFETDPCDDLRQLICTLEVSIIRFAVLCDNKPLVRAVLCRSRTRSRCTSLAQVIPTRRESRGRQQRFAFLLRCRFGRHDRTG